MQALEYNHEDFQRGRQSEADKSLLVKFFNKTKQDMIESKKQGRPVFHEVTYVSIDVPGNRLGGACHPATQADVQRFPEHWAAFKNRTTTEGLVGMPLTEWTKITRSQAEELAFLRIKTVEQLAEVSDGNGSQIMNFHALKAEAKKWLESAKENQAAEHLKAELAKRDEEIELLKAQMAELLAVQRETPKKRRVANRKKMAKDGTVIKQTTFVPAFAKDD